MICCPTINRTIVVALIISADDLILFGRKKEGGVYPDCWYLPGGGVREGEKLEETLQRELKEETGLDLNQLEAQIELIDDQGEGIREKNVDGERVLAKMKFFVFQVRLKQTASQLEIRAGDDLGELRWVGLNELHLIKHTPPSEKLLRRLGLY